MGYIGLMGLGVIGTPLAHLLYKNYRDDFVLLSDETHAQKMRRGKVYINKEIFSPSIITKKEQMDSEIDIIFICVKNYSLKNACTTLKKVIGENTVLVPLQNGVYAKDYLKKHFPGNIILEGFAQGPNTIKMAHGFVYQNPGVYHIGASNLENKSCAEMVYKLLCDIGIQCYYDDDILHAVWKKMMLNVAGNASTALTGIDYCMIKYSVEMQELCHSIMHEFQEVALKEGIVITDQDIDDTMTYFLSYNEAKHTSMLEDVINQQQTENQYIAGYIVKLAKKNGVKIPRIETLYRLMKIKEDVYLGKL